MDISVIIPYFNASKTILKTLESIKEQTLLPKEVIIIDDNSDEDKSISSLSLNLLQYPFTINLINLNQNLGAPSARNIGIRASTSDYLAFIDADDCWTKDKLRIQIQYMSDYDLLYTNYSEVKVTNSDKPSNLLPKLITYFDVLKKNLSPVTLIVKKSSVIMFDERFRRCDDFKMSIEALSKKLKIGYLDIYLAYGFKKAIGESGLTKSITKMSLSYLRACVFLIIENPNLFFIVSFFIMLEIIKFPIRCLKVFLLN
jgi:glycosyltransferase involved in cell wall biosynthesis